jgi:hypothetical protein
LEKEQSQFIFNQTNTFHQNMNSPIQIDYIRNNSVWLITFKFEANNSDAAILSTIKEYFQNFVGLNIKTRIYVIATSNGKIEMFEVYRKGSNLEMTIQLLCKLNGEIAEYVNTDDIWTRRKNLTGVSFQVGFIPNNMLFLKNNEVMKTELLNIVLHIYRMNIIIIIILERPPLSRIVIYSFL